MKARQLIIWFLALAAAAAAWFITDQVEERQAREEEASSRIVSLAEPMAVQVIELGGSQFPQPVRIERQEKEHRWFITQPVQCPADSMAVGRLISGLWQARSKSRLDGPGDLGQFGLAQPRLSVALTDAKGARCQVLVGGLSPNRDLLYVAPADHGAVWMVPAQLDGSLARDLFELREKTVLDFVVANVDRVDQKLNSGALNLTRQQGGAAPAWTVAGLGPADPTAVEDLLFQIHGLQAKEFVDQDIDEVKLGLNSPAGRIELGLAPAGQVGLVVGAAAAGAQRRWVRRLDGGPAMAVETASLARLERKPAEMLERHVLKIERGQVRGLKVRRDGHEVDFTRTEQGWSQAGGGGGEKADDTVDLLVWDLAALKWDQVLAPGEHGLAKPQAVLEVGSVTAAGQAQSQTLSLGRVDPASGLLAAQVQGDQRVLGIKPDLLAKLPGAAPEKAQDKP